MPAVVSVAVAVGRLAAAWASAAAVDSDQVVPVSDFRQEEMDKRNAPRRIEALRRRGDFMKEADVIGAGGRG